MSHLVLSNIKHASAHLYVWTQLTVWSSNAEGLTDIVQILKSVTLRVTFKNILDKLAVLLPNEKLFWLQILPPLLMTWGNRSIEG